MACLSYFPFTPLGMEARLPSALGTVVTWLPVLQVRPMAVY